MNKKAQALLDALRGVGIEAHISQWEESGLIQIDIDRQRETELHDECNQHFNWCIGDNQGFSFVLNAHGEIMEITE